ncbi:hypothetical protein [Pseudarthrobacter albicanus]|uniref:hypothetical protein n=1 Tax=Pseudarthrobacter albicanus TaxID=2823873 RepID=UPI001BA91FB9|nr:hypothetical protein [Pseudarthrobacter albicanus]
MNLDGFCRLCWRTAVGARPHGTGPSVIEMNRHGQQLFFVDLFRQNGRSASGPETPSTPPHHYPVAHAQLTLMDVPLELARISTPPVPPDTVFAGLLDRAAREHASAHGWSKTRLNTTRKGLLILACAQDTPGAAIAASEVAELDSTAYNRQPILDVLDAAGLLRDDRQPPIVAWFARQIMGLPGPITEELQMWFDTMIHGRTAPPRSRPRAPVTIRVRVRSALPAVQTWAAEGHTSLREIARADIDRALPAQGSARALTGSALRSLFRTLKAQRAVFTDPTTHTKTGSPETRTPLPINETAMRTALESDSPAQAALATLIGYHALRSGQVRALLLTDVRDGRLYLPDRTVLLAQPARRCLTAWLDYRNTQWPGSINPHLLVNIQTAVRTTQVSHVWINSTLGMSAQALREDRILDEAQATQDIRRLCDLFGLSVPAAERYLTTDHPSLMTATDNART